jgi:hypothetical protein
MVIAVYRSPAIIRNDSRNIYAFMQIQQNILLYTLYISKARKEAP